ncbi:MAG: xanthine dehydrogenase [Nitratireductor sp.]|nr:xanthine dehydrogenase [Nitratireductor sp.]
MFACQEDPIDAYLVNEDAAVLAFVAGIEGPSYRPLGAAMTVLGKHSWVGTLSSGCIEADIALHALEARQTGKPRLVRYGRGSPYIDIQLPCGGGLEILLLPHPDRHVLTTLQDHRNVRTPVALTIDVVSGEMALDPAASTERTDGTLSIQFEPELRFLIFGKGPEAITFAGLVQSAGYPNLLLSPDEETLNAGRSNACPTRHLTKPGFPDDIDVDYRTAIVLFFHDHDWEPPILVKTLHTDAFYIGAQGSRVAAATRREDLLALGTAPEDLDRLSGPVGLIPSARDARTLAVSVLSEVLVVAGEEAGDRAHHPGLRLRPDGSHGRTQSQHARQ